MDCEFTWSHTSQPTGWPRKWWGNSSSKNKVFIKKTTSSSDPHPETWFWDSFGHTIWKYVLDTYHNFLSGIYSDVLSGILSGIYPDIFQHTFWAPELAVEVRQCPLRCGTRSCQRRRGIRKQLGSLGKSGLYHAKRSSGILRQWHIFPLFVSPHENVIRTNEGII